MSELSKEKMLEMFKTMLKIRHFELRVKELVLKGSIRGAVHLYLGEEAVATGVCECLKKDDYITSTHRGHGHCIAKGGDINRMMAEILGKETGYCKGKGGSMHIADIDIGILGANGIVGGGLPISVGAAFSCKKRNTHQVVVSFFGDGASNQGAFHESLNMASVWKLPVVYVCENNQYAVSTHVSKSTSIKDISIRASSYGIEGRTVDGNDVLAVYNTAKELIDIARQGKGPSLLECKTYRWEGHYVGDPMGYRCKEDVDKQKAENDPIARFEEYLVSQKIVPVSEIDQIKKEIITLVNEAEKFAYESRNLPVGKVAEDIFA